MMQNKAKALLTGIVVAALLFSGSSCQRRAAEPKLVVVIVVDQLRFDYLERFKASFGSGGFRRLMERGADFANANYIYMPTYTAPGHAAIFTGSCPAYNGIVGNSWYDRESRRERVMVSDDAAKIVTSYGVQDSTKLTKPASPRVLIGATIGDQMRLSDGFRSKVIAISLKDRAAVLPGGRDANAAYWFDPSLGQFISSDYYLSELPSWVYKFNALQGPDRFFGKVWDRVLPPEAYQLTQGVTEAGNSPLGRHFPYTINGGAQRPGEAFYKAFLYSPFASEYLADFAKAAIEHENLGSDQYPDLLAISFSTPDYVGHAYGPDSEEIEDTYIRLDRVLDEFFQYLDKQVGLSNTILVLTADHGVSPVPQFLSLNKLDAGTIDPVKCRDAVNAALSSRFGEGKWVLDIVNEQVYLDRDLMAAQKADPPEVERVAAQALLTVPGIVLSFTRTQILSGEMPAGPIARKVSNGFNPARSGDVSFVTKPFSFLSEGDAATTHGSPYDYDTHVPLLLAGPGIVPARYYTECSPSDIAPTLAALLHIEPPPNIVGRVLVEAIKKEPR
ncbi:MAG TPA: alkaline phosphatase family protein [Blastocatellia bacterium]|nr:alkaline phosphatase family protein [Blastocatellia bacterium]